MELTITLPDVAPVEKLWGTEHWLTNRPSFCLKLLTLRPGFQSSLHYHREKDEEFFVVAGGVWLETLDGTNFLRAGDSALLLSGQRHRFWSIGGGDALILEVSTHHDDDDVVRLEPSRAIPNLGAAEGNELVR